MPIEENGSFHEEPERRLASFIEAFVAESPQNRFHLIDESPIFEEPLVGFADGDDPLFARYKDIIGPFHLTPREALERSFSPPPASPRLEHVSVVCWVLPIPKKTRATNARRDTWPSLRWAHTREYGEEVNQSLRRQVVSFLTERGYLAVAPADSPLFRVLDKLPDGPASTWSERHVLHAAGMGTFGLHDALITERGVAMRGGSVAVNLKLPAAARCYRSHTEHCPFFADKSCGMCMDRCPAGAITARGHNKRQCQQYLAEDLGHLQKRYGVRTVGCALCMTGVPCESRIPLPASV